MLHLCALQRIVDYCTEVQIAQWKELERIPAPRLTPTFPANLLHRRGLKGRCKLGDDDDGSRGAGNWAVLCLINCIEIGREEADAAK